MEPSREMSVISELDIIFEKLDRFPEDSKAAIEFFTEILTDNISPVLILLKKKFEESDKSRESSSQEVTDNESEIYFLCNNLILKYVNSLVDIFKEEIDGSFLLQESRNWALSRIKWSLKKFNFHYNKFYGLSENLKDTSTFDEYVEVCGGDDFITWVDDALDLQDLFTKMFKDDSEKFNLQNGDAEDLMSWKNECSSGILKLHSVIREMVSSAMKICQNCLTTDQGIIIARCHVVFRESKSFLGEIVTTDISMEDGVDLRKIKLKEDLHYPTVRLLNDMLRDAIYNLEASINRAVLSLVLHSMVYPVEPLQKALREQLDNNNHKLQAEICSNNSKWRNDIQETDLDDNDQFIEEFDIHNERLFQIGLFAVSCSSDRKRISMLKSCLITLESLEAHLVPSFLSDPKSIHSQILANHWTYEINSLRALVFLIIDPVALIELVMEKYRHQLMEMKNEPSLQWNSVQTLIGLGKAVLDFIQIYKIHEPKSFPQLEKLSNLIEDLKKVLKECRVITNLFVRNPSSVEYNYENGRAFSIQSSDQKQKEVRVLKRLKLLYALLLNISKEIIGEQSVDDDDVSTEDDNNIENDLKCQEIYTKDLTWTIPIKARSNQNSHQVPQRNKGILGILQNFKGNIRQGTLFTSDILKKDGTPPSNCSPTNKTFSRSYIARKTSNNKMRNTSHQRISKVLDYQRKRSVSTLVLNKEEFLLANVSAQDKQSVIQHAAGLTRNSHFSEENSKKVILMLNENSKLSRKHRRSLRKQLLKNRTAIVSGLSSPVSLNSSRLKPSRILSQSMKSTDPTLDFSSKTSENISIDWHITEILEQLTGLSNTLSLLRIDPCNETKLTPDNPQQHSPNTETEANEVMKPEGIDILHQKHIVTLKINDNQLCSPKKVWNIRVNDSSSHASQPTAGSETTFIKSQSNTINCEIDLSFGSNIPTPERMNDINLLEQKLADLRDFWK